MLSASSFTLATPIQQGESSTGDLSSETASKDNTTDPRKRNLLESTIASSSHQGEEKLGANGESLASNSESQWSGPLKSGPASSSMQRFGGDAEAQNAYQISQSGWTLTSPPSLLFSSGGQSFSSFSAVLLAFVFWVIFL